MENLSSLTSKLTDKLLAAIMHKYIRNKKTGSLIRLAVAKLHKHVENPSLLISKLTDKPLD